MKLCTIKSVESLESKSKMKKIAFTLLIFCTFLNVWSQTPQVMFYGYVEEGKLDIEETDKKKRSKEKPAAKLTGVNVYVYEGETLLSTQTARETGFYAAILNSGKTYHVVFEKEGYFCKSFELDCTNVTYPTEDAAIKCLTDVSLFKKVDDADLLNLCKVPFAKAKFDNSIHNLVWDMEYTARIKTKFQTLAQPYYTAEAK